MAERMLNTEQFRMVGTAQLCYDSLEHVLEVCNCGARITIGDFKTGEGCLGYYFDLREKGE